MTRRFLITVLAGALVAGAGVAAAKGPASPLTPAFSNTIQSTYPDGRVARLWLLADGTYKGQGRRGFYNGGRWSLKGAKTLCLKQVWPQKAPFSYCAPVVSGGVGTTWSGKAPTGERIRIKLVAGRKGFPAGKKAS